jgi:hypothetical protein
MLGGPFYDWVVKGQGAVDEHISCLLEELNLRNVEVWD